MDRGSVVNLSELHPSSMKDINKTLDIESKLFLTDTVAVVWLFFFPFPAYEQLMKEGAPGQGRVVTSERIILACPIRGVPGPSLIYWQRGLSVNASK